MVQYIKKIKKKKAKLNREERLAYTYERERQLDFKQSGNDLNIFFELQNKFYKSNEAICRN